MAVFQIVPPPYSPFLIATAVSTTVLASRNLYLFYFISFAKKNKQTNGKKVGRDTATAVANYSGPGYQ